MESSVLVGNLHSAQSETMDPQICSYLQQDREIFYGSSTTNDFDEGKPPLTDHFPAHGSAEDRMDDHQCYLLNQLAGINPKQSISLLFVELFMDKDIRAGSRRGVVLVYG